jgi:hypothetical protein
LHAVLSLDAWLGIPLQIRQTKTWPAVNNYLQIARQSIDEKHKSMKQTLFFYIPTHVIDVINRAYAHG